MNIDLYRLYDADTNLLYVGISGSAIRRAAQHARQKSWWDQVASIDIVHLGVANRDQAEAIEEAVIRHERPRYNVTHNQPPAPGFRPTTAMEQVSLAVEAQPRPIGAIACSLPLKVKKSALVEAVKALVDEGYVEDRDGLIVSCRPFRHPTSTTSFTTKALDF